MARKRKIPLRRRIMSAEACCTDDNYDDDESDDYDEQDDYDYDDPFIDDSKTNDSLQVHNTKLAKIEIVKSEIVGRMIGMEHVFKLNLPIDENIWFYENLMMLAKYEQYTDN